MRRSLANSFFLGFDEAIACPSRISLCNQRCVLSFQRNGDSEAPAQRPFRDNSSTAFVNQETRRTVHQFLTPCFVVRKMFSQRGLKSCLPSQIGWIPDCIIRMCQWVTDFDCCHRPSVDLSSQWGFLMKIIATMHNADWAAIISR